MNEPTRQIPVQIGGSSNGSLPPSKPTSVSSFQDDEEKVKNTEIFLGIVVSENGIRPTLEGIIAIAKEFQIPLLSSKKLAWVKSMTQLSSIGVGIAYSHVLSTLFDIKSLLGNMLFLTVGVIFAMAASTIVSHFWYYHVKASFDFENKRSNWIVAVIVSIAVGVIDFSCIGNFIHNLLTEDLFGIPADFTTLLATYGLSLMTASTLVLLAKIRGSEEARFDLCSESVVSRAMNFFPKEISEAIAIRRRIKETKLQKIWTNHKPR